MSRVGKKPVVLKDGVKAEIKNGIVSFTGPKGTLSFVVHPKVTVAMDGSNIIVSVQNEAEKKQKALWGMTRSILANLAIGVTKGFQKQLEVNGVGFKVALQGKQLNLALGFSHPIIVDIPEGLAVTVDKNLITISGADKQAVGQFAAKVRDLKKP
ncbi:MAG TPA: 50S ribosomal protein L6, partial [Patescibacteria group bacterium]|nr:50S ribosomal protein L6 [Patescibacteria group bacterium]